MLHQSTLIAMLKSRYQSLAQVRTINGTQESVNWIPILGYEAGFINAGHCYGLVVEYGTWAAAYGATSISHARQMVAFYVLLELPFRELVAALKSALEKTGLPVTLVQTFPFDQLLESALEHGSYWGDLAHAWLNDGYPPNDRIAALASSNRAVRAWRTARQESIFGKLKKA